MKRILSIIIVSLLAVSPVFSQKKEVYKVSTVVIDPGQGGAKPGAQGKRSQEKDITLAVAKKFGKLLEDNYPDMKVIYTRTTDVDISLAERAQIANRNKADLFISIHANSHPTSAPTGVETFVMGLSESKANLEVARKENTDILLEADYKNNSDYSGFDPNAPETYVMLAMFQNAFIDKSLILASAIQGQYRQRLKTINRGVKQAELYVLYKTTCPSVLTEVGFISNPDEESFMMSEEGQATIAICLFNAFMSYKAAEEGTPRPANPKFDIAGYVPEGAARPAATVQHQADTAVAEAQVAEPPIDTVKPSEPQPVQAAGNAPAKSDSVQPQPSVKPVVTPADKPLPAVDLPPVHTADKPATQQAPPKAEPPATKDVVTYRVQFCTAMREMKVGDPDLHGIKDFYIARNGKHFVYTAGNYSSLTEARNRCKQIQDSTRFKDAFVVAIYRGTRITLERAAQIEKKSK